jgi:hypothetical protein
MAIALAELGQVEDELVAVAIPRQDGLRPSAEPGDWLCRRGQGRCQLVGARHVDGAQQHGTAAIGGRRQADEIGLARLVRLDDRRFRNDVAGSVGASQRRKDSPARRPGSPGNERPAPGRGTQEGRAAYQAPAAPARACGRASR